MPTDKEVTILTVAHEAVPNGRARDILDDLLKFGGTAFSQQRLALLVVSDLFRRLILEEGFTVEAATEIYEAAFIVSEAHGEG